VSLAIVDSFRPLTRVTRSTNRLDVGDIIRAVTDKRDDVIDSQFSLFATGKTEWPALFTKVTPFFSGVIPLCTNLSSASPVGLRGHLIRIFPPPSSTTLPLPIRILAPPLDAIAFNFIRISLAPAAFRFTNFVGVCLPPTARHLVNFVRILPVPLGYTGEALFSVTGVILTVLFSFTHLTVGGATIVRRCSTVKFIKGFLELASTASFEYTSHVSLLTEIGRALVGNATQGIYIPNCTMRNLICQAHLLFN